MMTMIDDDECCDGTSISENLVISSVETIRDSMGKTGRLTMVGTGITAVAHLSLEAIGHIKCADVIFYHVNSGVTASRIRQLNPNAVDVYAYYGEGKRRRITYIQIAELMLREVRRGLRVAGVFHGHPGLFVWAARRALAIADMEGYETRLLPGISSIDCLFADLRIDPGIFGCQILKAGLLIRNSVTLATDGHVILVQIGSVGDRTFSFSGYKATKFEVLFEKLSSIYGEDQEAVYYEAPIFPGLPPIIRTHTLRAYQNPGLQDEIGTALLYLPPKGRSFASLAHRLAFHDRSPYGKAEEAAIEALALHKVPNEYKLRVASAALLRAMEELATDPVAADIFHHTPDLFLSNHPDLDAKERAALLSMTTGSVRAVTTRTGFNQNG
jgi:hypothetical protein